MLVCNVLNHKDYVSFEDKMKQYKLNKPHDKIFKLTSKTFPQGFFNVFNIPIKYKGFLDTEIITNFYQEFKSDIIVESLDDSIFILEFQSSLIIFNDVFRFGSYVTNVWLREKKDVYIYILSTAGEKWKKHEFKFGCIKFTICIISLTDFDYNKTLNRIVDKKKNNEEFTDEDFVLIVVLPYMTKDKNKIKELLFETANLTNDIYNLIDEDVLLFIKSTQFILACEYLDDYEIEDMAKVLTMKSVEKEEVFQGYLSKEETEEAMAKGEIKGEIKGEFKERIKIAKNLINLGISFDVIKTATSLDDAELISLKDGVFMPYYV